MLLALAVALPFVLLTAGIMWQLANNERETRREAILFSTRTLMNAVDTVHAIVLADPSQANAFEQGLASLEALLEKLRQPITPRRGLDLSRPPAADPVFQAAQESERDRVYFNPSVRDGLPRSLIHIRFRSCGWRAIRASITVGLASR